VVRPEQTEGPYFVDDRLDRSDIRSDPTDGAIADGVPLDLTFQTSMMKEAGCVPLPGAVVDVWSCDALGVYSDVEDRSFDTRGKKFLRGYQITDASGSARFTTIVPGWYPGRTPHIHFKIRTAPAEARGLEFTSQLYFEDDLIDQIHARPPYATHGRRRGRNADDGIFSRGGSELLLSLVPSGDGYAATFEVALA
jgi:protocatechuate 3,4-dioxygenase beta subunit